MYVITQGGWDDLEILGYCSSEELAKQYCWKNYWCSYKKVDGLDDEATKIEIPNVFRHSITFYRREGEQWPGSITGYGCRHVYHEEEFECSKPQFEQQGPDINKCV